jgi:predicted dehydrogenase
MDTALDLTGWPRITSVSATTYRGLPHKLPKNVTFDVEEHCTVLARGEKNLTLTFDLAWMANHSTTRRIAILGTRGGIRMDDQSPFTFFSDKDNPWHWMNTTTEWHDKRGGSDRIYEDFVEAVRGRDPGVGTTPEQALALTELTRMALLSAKEGREVKRSELKSVD